MLIAADYPFLEVFWTILVFFSWVVWIWIVVTVLIDLFRRDDISGWGKPGWVVFVIVLPFLGVLVYLIAQHDGMRERSAKQAEAISTRSTNTCGTRPAGRRPRSPRPRNSSTRERSPSRSSTRSSRRPSRSWSSQAVRRLARSRGPSA
jgi:Phospholipase_D-nuclease N-terminal